MRSRFQSHHGIAIGLMMGLVLTGTLAVAQEDTSLLDKAGVDFSQGHYKSAARNYRKALRKDPTEPTAYLGLSMALRSEGKINESRNILTQLIQLYPKFAPAYYNLGEILESQGDLSGAKTAYQNFVTHSGNQLPKSPEIRIKLRKFDLL